MDILLNTLENDDRIFVTLQLNGKSALFGCDSVSRVSIMNMVDFKQLKINAPVQKKIYTV